MEMQADYDAALTQVLGPNRGLEGDLYVRNHKWTFENGNEHLKTHMHVAADLWRCF